MVTGGWRPAALALRAADEGGSFAACELERARAFGWSQAFVQRLVGGDRERGGGGGWRRARASRRSSGRGCGEEHARAARARHGRDVRGHCVVGFDCGQPELTHAGTGVGRRYCARRFWAADAPGGGAGSPGRRRCPTRICRYLSSGDPDACLEGVFACIDAWSALGGHADERPPLVVNTAVGWGLGLELAEDALRRIGRVVVDRGDTRRPCQLTRGEQERRRQCSMVL